MRKHSIVSAAAVALIAGAAYTAQAFTYSQPVLVYCPPSDSAGCETIVAAVENATRAFDGTNGTVDLRSADLSSYAALVIPSLADDGELAPYSLLRDSTVAAHLRQSVLGRRAFWSGTPDQGSTNREAKNALIVRLLEWAGGNQVNVGAPGLVVLHDGSAGAPYDWVAGITGINVVPDPRIATYGSVRAVTAIGAAIVGDAAYTNMATRGYYLPQGAAGISLDAVGQTGTPIGGQVVLMTHPGVAESEAVVATDKDDYEPGETVVISGSGYLVGEEIILSLQEDPEVHEIRSYSVTADSTGAFVFDGFAPEEHDLNVRFILTAAGQTSGRSAQTTFTDAITRTVTDFYGNAHTTNDTLSVPSPALAAAAGDVLIAQITIAEVTTGLVCAPAGWVQEVDNSASAKVRQVIFWRVVPAGGEAGGTLHRFRFKGSGTCGNDLNLASRSVTGHILRYSGVDNVDPTDASAGSSNTSSSTSFVAPSVNTNVANTMVLRFVGVFKNSGSLSQHGSSATSAALLYSNGSSSNKERHAGAWEALQASPDATNTFTATGSSAEWVAQTVALKPAVAAGPTKLDITTSAHTGVVNECLGVITVQTQDAGSAPTNVTGNTEVSLASNGTGTFYSDNACTNDITQVTINTGNNSANFYYKATARGTGTHQITVSAGGLTQDQQNQTINKANQATLTVTAPSAITYGNTGTATSSGGSGTGLVSFSHGSSTGCSVSGTTVSVTNASGTCSLTATKAADDNYEDATSAEFPVTLSKATQATLTVTGPSSVAFGNTGTATSSGGSGTGLVSFSHGSSTGCSVSGTTVSVGDASGTCSLTATKAADDNYEEATSAAFPVTLDKATQATLTVTAPSSVTYGNTGTATSSGGSGTGLVSFSHGSSTGCSVSGTTVSVTNASGTCSLTATKAADDNYEEATSAAFPVTLNKATQATLTVTAPSAITYGNTGTATSSGGSGTGLVSFSHGGSTGCSVSGTTVSVSNVSGTCSLTATKAADDNYEEATSAPFDVTLTKATQATLTVTAPSSVTFGTTGTATSSGGSGTGLVSFSHGSSTGCSVSGTTVSVSDASGTCSLTATKAADDNYEEATSAAFPVTLNKAATQTTAANKFATFASVDQVVTVTATVTSTAGTVSEGKVTFTVKSGATTIGTAVEGNVAAGSASASYTLPGGTVNGVYTIEAAYSNGTNYANSSDNTKTLTVNQADAESDYNGDTWIQATSNGAASITLSAVIRAADVLPASLSGARVSFVDVQGGNSPLGTCKDVRVDITDASNPTQGKATCVWTVTLSKSETSRTVTVGVFIGGTHKNKNLVGDPDFTGSIVITRNAPYTMVGAGQVNGAAPSSMLGTAGTASFGMSLSYTNKLTNPQGSAWATFIVDGVLYLAKSNSLNNFSVNGTPPGGTSIFSTKANISRWDVPTNAWVSFEGSATLQFAVTDGGGNPNAGTGDKIAITVSGKNGGLVYSNNWDRGTGRAVEEAFATVNVVIQTR